MDNNFETQRVVFYQPPTELDTLHEVLQQVKRKTEILNGGLRDIVIESGLMGSGTVEAVFKGKHDNYGIRMIKIVSEALFRLKIDVFKEWLIQKVKEEVLRQFLNSEEVIELIKNPDPAHHRNTQWSFESLSKLLISFEEEIRQNIFGPTVQFWQSFLDMSQV